MIKMWIIVVLMTQQCLTEKKAREEVRAQEPNRVYRIDEYPKVFFRIGPNNNSSQASMLMPSRDEYSAAGLVLSKEYPEFEVTGDTGCYTVSVASLPIVVNSAAAPPVGKHKNIVSRCPCDGKPECSCDWEIGSYYYSDGCNTISCGPMGGCGTTALACPRRDWRLDE